MAKKPSSDILDAEPLELDEPDFDLDEIMDDKDSADIWKRGVVMVVVGILFGLAQAMMGIAAILQFLWMLIKGEKNRNIADFGGDLSKWQAKASRFLTGASEARPFPWTPFSD